MEFIHPWRRNVACYRSNVTFISTVFNIEEKWYLVCVQQLDLSVSNGLSSFGKIQLDSATLEFNNTFSVKLKHMLLY